MRVEPQRVEPEIADDAGRAAQQRWHAAAREAVCQPAPKPTPIGDIAMALQHLGRSRAQGHGGRRGAKCRHDAFRADAGARACRRRAAGWCCAIWRCNAPNISVLSTDPQAPGFAELVRGTASFGDIVTRDKFSRVHLIATGRVAGDAQAILSSPRLVITLEALARTYDNVVIDAGAIGDAALHPLARMAPRAILVAIDLADPATQSARQQLMVAGFADVTLIQGTPVSRRGSHAAA